MIAAQDVVNPEKQGVQCYRTSMCNAAVSAFGLQFTKWRSILEQHAVKDPARFRLGVKCLARIGQHRGLFLGLLSRGRQSGTARGMVDRSLDSPAGGKGNWCETI